MGKRISECTAEDIENTLNDDKSIAFLGKDIEDILKGKSAKITKNNVALYHSYNFSYVPIVEYYHCLYKQDDVKKWLIGGASLVYSWMPTSLTLHPCYENKAMRSLEKMKEHQDGNHISKLIAPLRSFINNSIRGTSKFLHFSFPEVFPIWDSRVARALKYTDAIFNAGENNNDIRQYLAYVKAVNEVCNNKVLLKELDKIHLLKKMESIRKIEQMEAIRKIEHALFLIGYMYKKKKKSN